MHAYRSMCITNDLYCTVEFISMIKASRLITIKGLRLGQVLKSLRIEASVYYYNLLKTLYHMHEHHWCQTLGAVRFVVMILYYAGS